MESTSVLISLRFTGQQFYTHDDENTHGVEESMAELLQDLVDRLRRGEALESMHTEHLYTLGGRKVGIIYVDGR